MNRHLVGAAVLVAVALALTGCSRAATFGTAPASPPSVSGAPATSGTAPASPPSVSGAPAGAATTAPATAAGSATDAGTLDGISQDLNSADSANAQTDADQQNADHATATSDG
jgi:hypothetical protein